VSTYQQIAWLPLCAGLTGLGLVLSYLAMRRRGIGSGLRWAAWSLLPLAIYLTGSTEMFWKMGVAVGDFAKGFLFSPRVWSGIAVAGLAVVLFIVSGPLRRGRVSRGQDAKAAASAAGPAGSLPASAAGGQLATRPGATVPAAGPAKAPAKARKAKNADDDDDDLGDVADILRRHGIT
jgi:hypothetical protein